MSNLNHKPDISKANDCPPLPANASGFDKLVYWLGIGLGSGLPKKAPGTWGTLGGLLVGLPLMLIGFMPFLLITLIASVVGIWICGRTSELMNVHDDPHIVWDEWAGMWIAMLPVVYLLDNAGSEDLMYKVLPIIALLVVIAFTLFRFFDIIKPFPIGYLDKKLDGGLGIMLDDILAGIFTLILLMFALTVFV